MKITVHKSVKIKVNGVEYDSVEHMPPEVRALYDKALYGARDSITVNAQISGTLDRVPPELNGIVGQALEDPLERPAMPSWVVGVAIAIVAVLSYLYLFRGR